MKKDKLAGLGTEELRTKLSEMTDESFQLKFRLAMGQTEGVRKIRENRKDRARVLTYLRQRELAAKEGAK